jgi:hypothetical protein
MRLIAWNTLPTLCSRSFAKVKASAYRPAAKRQTVSDQAICGGALDLSLLHRDLSARGRHTFCRLLSTAGGARRRRSAQHALSGNDTVR